MPVPSVSEIIALVKTGATIEAQEKIMELRQAVMDLQEENLQLRTKVQAVEAAAALVGKPKLPPCPRCGMPTWALEKSEPDEMFGPLGGVRRHYRCQTCDFTEDKLHTPD